MKGFFDNRTLGSRVVLQKPDLSLLSLEATNASHNFITPKWDLVIPVTTLLWSSQSLNSVNKSF